MDLILWRHAEAAPHGDPADDLSRELTAKGIRQAERMAKWLSALLADSTKVIVSPAARCQQTAKALGRKWKTIDAIGPDVEAQTVLDAAGWPSASHAVLVVGHQPTLGAAAALALCGAEQPWAMKKGAVWWLRHRERDDDEEPVSVVAVQAPDWL